MTLLPGDRLGDWVVERALGAGGMGSVYRCHSALASDVRAAVKVLTDPRSADQRARFIQEMRTLSSLSHPGVVRVLGGGHDEDRDLLFIAMELIDGASLEDRLRDGPLPVELALSVFRTVAAALAHAHQAGVAHRDVKPANLMIRHTGEAVLVDFGIAFSRDRARMTQEGTFPGTLAYLPPETFHGQVPDPKGCDAYAFGVTFFEALTGTEAFPITQDGSDGQRLAQISGLKMRATMLDPGASFSETAREVIRATTKPEPEGRWVDLSAIAARLEGSILPARTISNETWEAPLAPPPPPRRWLGGALVAGSALLFGGSLLAAGAAVLAVVLGAVWWQVQSQAPEPRETVALDATLRDGVGALEAGEIGRARRLAARAVDNYPEEPSANLLYGQALALDGSATLARPYLCAAVRGGLREELGGLLDGLTCDRGPAASTPLTSPLAMARLQDPTMVVADLFEDEELEEEAEEVSEPPPAVQPATSSPREVAGTGSGSGDAIVDLADGRGRGAGRSTRSSSRTGAERDAAPAGGGLADQPAAARSADVQKVIDRSSSGFNRCLTSARADHPDLTARLTITLVIDPTGRAIRTRVRAWDLPIKRDTDEGRAIDRCLAMALRALRFPASDGSTEIAVRLVISGS